MQDQAWNLRLPYSKLAAGWRSMREFPAKACAPHPPKEAIMNKKTRRAGFALTLATMATSVAPWLGGMALPTVGIGAIGLTLAAPAQSQGLGSGKEGEGQHNQTGQGGGGVGASGSGPQGSGAQGDSHAPAGTDPATKSDTKPDSKSGNDNDAVTNKDVQRLYTPPQTQPQDRNAPANMEKPAR